ncbi:hypothetical protein QWZ13_19630 [Reinekea marina]|uniref:hypothetical protein n=1 Tax=Reinekea marina TaxID=1310421 RepID=UPI0025B45330|nr:hypothetical protein [Reinekea marina]MDN3651127.1 hypothetical protein [Reinekea marina]
MRRSEALYQPSYRDIVDELSQPVAVFDNYFNLIYANLQFNEHVSRKPTSLFELLPNTANIDTQQIQQTLLIDGRWQSHVESQTQSGQSLYLTLTSLNSDGRQRYVALLNLACWLPPRTSRLFTRKTR